MILHAQLLRSCPTLCHPTHCSPPDPFVHGILQARILEWVACPALGDLPEPGIAPASLLSPALTDGSQVWCLQPRDSRNVLARMQSPQATPGPYGIADGNADFQTLGPGSPASTSRRSARTLYERPLQTRPSLVLLTRKRPVFEWSASFVLLSSGFSWRTCLRRHTRNPTMTSSKSWYVERSYQGFLVHPNVQ